MISLRQQSTEHFSVKPENSFSDVWHTLKTNASTQGRCDQILDIYSCARLPKSHTGSIKYFSYSISNCYSTGGCHSAWHWISWVPMYIWDRATILLEWKQNTNRIDFIWNEIAKIIDQCTVQPKFKHLPKLVKFLLLIPPSNAYCESIFSTIKKICTDDRHNLGKDATGGHASRNVYQSATRIRNNLVRL